MNIEELEYWKLRITDVRNFLVAEHSQLLREKELYKTFNEVMYREDKLYEFSKRIKRMKKFYDRLTKKQ